MKTRAIIGILVTLFLLSMLSMAFIACAEKAYNEDAGGFPSHVTISAYCYTEAKPVSVNITMDGNPTGYTTPHAFSGLTTTHTFTVPDTDPNGHPFREWNTGETSTTITVPPVAARTAYYGTTEFATVSVNPQVMNVTPSSIFRINITVANVSNLWGYQYLLWYDTTVLTAIEAGYYPPFEQGFPGWPVLDNVNGYVADIRFGVWLWPGLSTVDPVPITWIDFLVDDFGNTTLPFDTWRTKLVDYAGNAIQSPWNLMMVDGYFDNLPVQPIQRLIKVIEIWNLPKNTEKSLTPKLEEANHLLDKGNENGAIRKLNDFINHVEALRDKEKLTDKQAEYLIAGAQAIIDSLV